MEPEFFVSIDNTRLYCRKQGSGPPVLLVHGLGVSSYTWRYNEEKPKEVNEHILSFLCKES